MKAHSPPPNRLGLDDLLGSPARLALLALLSNVDDVEFGSAREAIGVSDSVLSKQVSALEAAGYVEVRKGYVGKRPRTWLSATILGRERLAAHVAALVAVASQFTNPPSAPQPTGS